MIVTCPKCQAKFNLDESKIPPEGAWVRCSKCDEVFQVFPPGAPQPDFDDDESSDLDGDLFGDEVDTGFDAEPEGKGRGSLFKVFFWILGIIILIGVLGVGAIVTMGRMGVGGAIINQFSEVPVLRELIGSPAQTNIAQPMELPPHEVMRFVNITGSYRINNHVNYLFVIRGRLENISNTTRTEIKLRAVLLNDKKQRLVTAMSFAGPVLDDDQLREMTMEDIEKVLLSPMGADGAKFAVAPGADIPFTMVFADIPNNVSDYAAEVMSTKPLEESPAAQEPTPEATEAP